MAPGEYILNNSKSSPNEFEKQVSCESIGNFLQNRRKPDSFTYFCPIWGQKEPKNMVPGGPHSSLLKVFTVRLKKQVSRESGGNLLQYKQKTDFWPNLGPIRVQKGPQNMCPGGYTIHIPESTPDMHVNQVS